MVTSRDPLVKTSPWIAKRYIDVKPFRKKEAAVLLRNLLYINREKDISLKIVQKLGGISFAISQIAAIIRYQFLTFYEFLERYDDEPDCKEFFDFESEAPRRQARGNLASIWAVEQLDPQAKTILELCTILDPDCIQDRIFVEGIGSVDNLNDYFKTIFTYITVRTDLLKRSLVKRNKK